MRKPARCMLQQRIVHPVGDDHHRLARPGTHRHGVQSRILRDHPGADRVDIGEGDVGARPQGEGGKAEQARARADIGDIAGHNAARLHRAQHFEATGGGLVLPGAEGLTGGDDEVDQGWVGGVIGGVDMEAARADRARVVLAERHPVGGRQFLDGDWRRFAFEQPRERGCLGLAGLPRIPAFEHPVIGPVLGHFPARDDEFAVPVVNQVMRQQRGLHDRLGGKSGKPPGRTIGQSSLHWHRSPPRSCSAAHPRRRRR